MQVSSPEGYQEQLSAKTPSDTYVSAVKPKIENLENGILLVDKSKLDYSQIVEAIKITSAQIQKIFNYMKSNEGRGIYLITEQKNSFIECLKALEKIQKIIYEQKEEVERKLDFINQRILKYKKKLDEKNEKSRKFEESIYKIENQLSIISKKSQDFEDEKLLIIKSLDKNCFDTAKNLLSINNETLWKIYEVVLSILKGKEINHADIQLFFSDYSSFISTLSSKNYEKFSKELILKYMNELQTLESNLQNSKLSENSQESFYKPIRYGIIIGKIMMNHKEFIQTQEAFQNVKKEFENCTGNSKEDENPIDYTFTDNTYIIGQLLSYKKILQIININIQFLQTEISKCDENIAYYNSEAFKSIRNNLSNDEIEAIYKKNP